MKKFLKVSILILLTQIFVQETSVAMDTKEKSDHQEITFSAHQKVFHAKLEELKKVL